MVGQLQSHFVISKCLRVRKSTWVFATYFWDFSNSDLFFSTCLIEVLVLNEIHIFDPFGENYSTDPIGRLFRCYTYTYDMNVFTITKLKKKCNLLCNRYKT